MYPLLKTTLCLFLAFFLAPKRASSSQENCTHQLTLPLNAIRQETNMPWLPLPNRVRWVLSKHLPDSKHITGSYVLAINGDHILLGRHRERGWDILGGHVDAAEHPEKTARREAFEESAATIGPMQLLAYQEIELLGQKPKDYKYSHPKSYQTFYIGQVESLTEFQIEEDMVERKWFTLEEAAREVSWMKNNVDLFQAAIEMSKRQYSSVPAVVTEPSAHLE